MADKRDKLIKAFVSKRKNDAFGKKFGASAGDRIKQKSRPGYQPHGDPLDNYIERSRRERMREAYGKTLISKQ